jgi:hypothetical protein
MGGRMDDSEIMAVAPNVVLRGGPLDGERLHLGSRRPLRVEVGDERAIYRPTHELDSEFETLAVWVYDHAAPV